jgi:hypothetical protein
LAVEADPGSKPASVVLDLGAVVPLSRLRIVWGAKESVPQQWKVEISEDGTSWKPWLAVDKCVTDAYDQWPGFEYYAPEQSAARYVRYAPVGESEKKPVKLRQLSLFRSPPTVVFEKRRARGKTLLQNPASRGTGTPFQKTLGRLGCCGE